MIGKLLADMLEMIASYLEPCPFVILTSARGMEHAIGQTKELLCLIFRVGAGPIYSCLSLKCAVTNATNYDVLVGHQALYHLGFGVHNWVEEAWI